MVGRLAVLLACFGLVLGVSIDPADAARRHRHHHDHEHEHDHAHEKKKPRKKQARQVARTPQTHVHDAHRHAPHAPHAHPPGEHAHGIETESLFAFLSGSDIGEKGEKHLTLDFEGHFQKRDGTFRALTKKVELGFNPSDRLHVALELWGDYFKVLGVTGFDDQDRFGGGVALEFKALLVKRNSVGVALVVAPHYGTSEHVTGEAAIHYALEVKLILDAELIKDRLFAALNLLYEPELVRPRGEPAFERESMLGLSAAVMARVAQAVFLGAEVQYFRKYEGLALQVFAGHALYLGPALFIKLSEHASLTFGWAIQVAGRAVGDPAPLDLVNFERQRAKAKFSTHF
jgi:hypothetical protein